MIQVSGFFLQGRRPVDIKILESFIHEDLLFSQFSRCCGGGLQAPASLSLHLSHTCPEGETHRGRKILGGTLSDCTLSTETGLWPLPPYTTLSSRMENSLGQSCFVCGLSYSSTYLDHHFLISVGAVISKYDFSIEIFQNIFLIMHILICSQKGGWFEFPSLLLLNVDVWFILILT